MRELHEASWTRFLSTMKEHLEENRATPTLPEWPIAALELGCDSFSAQFLLFLSSIAAELTVTNAGFKLTPGALQGCQHDWATCSGYGHTGNADHRLFTIQFAH